RVQIVDVFSRNPIHDKERTVVSKGIDSTDADLGRVARLAAAQNGHAGCTALQLGGHVGCGLLYQILYVYNRYGASQVFFLLGTVSYYHNLFQTGHVGFQRDVDDGLVACRPFNVLIPQKGEYENLTGSRI